MSEENEFVGLTDEQCIDRSISDGRKISQMATRRTKAVLAASRTNDGWREELEEKGTDLRTMLIGIVSAFSYETDLDYTALKKWAAIVHKAGVEAGVKIDQGPSTVIAADIMHEIVALLKRSQIRAGFAADRILSRVWISVFGAGPVPNNWLTGTTWSMTAKEDLNRPLSQKLVDSKHTALCAMRWAEENESFDEAFARIDKDIYAAADRAKEREPEIQDPPENPPQTLLDNLVLRRSGGRKEDLSGETAKQLVDNIARLVRTDFGGQDPRSVIEKQMAEAGVEPTQAAVDFVIHKMRQTSEGIRARITPRLNALRTRIAQGKEGAL